MRIYRVPLPATSVSAAIDLFELNPTTSQLCWITAVRFSQTSDVGDAQDEAMLVKLITGYTSSGSGGNSPTADKHGDAGYAAFGGTVETMNTTQASGGSPATYNLGVWWVRSEFIYEPVPKVDTPEGYGIPYNTRAVITLPAPTDALTIAGWVEFGVRGAA